VNTVLTPDEVAEFLRTDLANVLRLLDDGTLAGFKVAGEWRIVTPAITAYLKRAMAETQEQVLMKMASDPRTWAEVFRDEPDLLALIDGQEHEEGTMGAFVKEALLADEQLRTAENVVPFERKPD
jgi:excisionase family DNA binding protein